MFLVAFCPVIQPFTYILSLLQYTEKENALFVYAEHRNFGQEKLQSKTSDRIALPNWAIEAVGCWPFPNSNPVDEMERGRAKFADA
jgi:hypothetical protein